MADPLKIQTEVDLSGVNAFNRGMDAAAQNAAKFARQLMAEGMSAQQAAAAMAGAGVEADSINAAFQSLGSTTAATAAATENVASGFNRAGRMSGYLAGRLAFIGSNMGYLGGMAGMVAQSFTGLGPLLIAAIPAAAITIGIELWEKYKNAAIEVANADHAVAEASQKQNDELLKLNEQYAGLVGGPMKQYEQELRDIPLLSLNLDAETKVLSEDIKKQTGWFSKAAAAVQEFIHAAVGPSGPGILGKSYGTEDAVKAITLINDKVRQNLNVSAAISAIDAEITKAQGALNSEKAAGLSLDVQQTQIALNALNTEKQYLLTQRQITAAKERNARAEAGKEWKTFAEGFKGGGKGQMSVWLKDYYADLIKNAKPERDALIGVVTSTHDQLSAVERALTQQDIANARDDANRIRTAMTNVEARRAVALPGGTTSADRSAIASYQQLIAQTQETMQRLRGDIAAINAQPFLSATDIASLQKYNDELSNQQKLVAQITLRQAELGKEIDATWSKIGDKAGKDFSHALMQGMLERGGFGQAFAQLWNQMAEAALSKGFSTLFSRLFSGVTSQAAAASQAGLAQQKATDQASKQSSSSVAAANVFKWISDIPVVGPFLAPAMAAAAKAMVLSFAQGGIMPETNIAMLHQNEMVLPPKISAWVQQAAAGGGAAAAESHFHFHAGVTAMDTGSLHSFLRTNSRAFGRAAAKYVRRRA